MRVNRVHGSLPGWLPFKQIVMVDSFKGIAVYFCVVMLLAATAVSAQDMGAAGDAAETARAADGQRFRTLANVPKPLSDASAIDPAYHAIDTTARRITITTSENDSEPKTQPYAAAETPVTESGEDLERYSPMWSEEDLRRNFAETARFPSPVEPTFDSEKADDPDDTELAPPRDKFHWKPAIYQSLIAQGFQHSYALIFQEKTQRALKGPFFKDYWESVKGVRGWSDGNKFFTNYIAHPMQGSMTGFIYLQNHDRLKRQMFAESKQYWKDRARALLWSAAWSTNWELGPISQSTIGNVGLYGKQGYVDLVITPTVGTAWMITEEALDRYIIRHAEGNLTARILLRTVLNPTRSVTNMLRFKKPWYRDRAN